MTLRDDIFEVTGAIVGEDPLPHTVAELRSAGATSRHLMLVEDAVEACEADVMGFGDCVARGAGLVVGDDCILVYSDQAAATAHAVSIACERVWGVAPIKWAVSRTVASLRPARGLRHTRPC